MKCKYCGKELWGTTDLQHVFMYCSFCGRANVISDIFGLIPIDKLKTNIKGDHSFEKKK